MKINPEAFMDRNNTVCFDGKTDLDFETVLNSPAKDTSGGDYYRQHQTHLQQSSLKFEGMQRPSEVETLQTISLIPIKNLNPLGTEAALNTKPSEIQNSTTVLEPVRPLTPDLKEFITHINTFMQPRYGFVQNRIQNNNIIQKHSKTSPSNFPSFPTSVFKNYQCHINNNEAELSLNTQGLSPEEKLHLEKMIKQWLSHKGLVLRTLLINGEQQ